jgi:hypothetical protein
VISESTERLEVVVDAALNGFGIDRLTAFNESCLLVQDLPDDAAEPVRNGPDAFSESQTHDKAPSRPPVQPGRVHGAGNGCLWRTPGVVLAGALVAARTDSHPGSQLGRRGKGRRRSDLSDNFLRGFGADSGEFNEPYHGILMGLQQRGEAFVQLFDLLIE